MQTLLSKILNNKNTPFIITLLTIILLIGLLNFPYGKWLLGWDNIVPELNFIENLKRGFFSLWQENEGLGLNGGHGFAATLPHTVIVFLFSLLFPTEMLRPLFHIFMYALGGFGTYYLFIHLFRNNTHIHARFGALLASIFYLVNFATVQMFYIPLEAFSAHFAFLPWLLVTFFKLIQHPTKKNIVMYCVISILASMQGFIPPLFVVYILFLGIAGFIGIFRFKNELGKFIKRYILAVLITTCTNAYWLLPTAYYTFVNSNVYLNAYNNITQTNEFILKNQKFGSFTDLVFLRGFIYESGDVTTTGETTLIFGPWINHFNNPIITTLSIGLFLLIIIGLFWGIKKKSWEIKALAGMFLITFLFLATNVPVLSVISEFIRNNIPILKQAFRIPFTKFAVSLSLFYSLFIGFGFIALLELFSHIKKINITIISIATCIVVSLGIFYVGLPTFQGNLFYKKIHVELPESYLNTFNYLKTQKNSERIAHFPTTSPTGWSFYKWGYTGSGFLWYGLSQPILDRNFDVWSNYNENFYWEVNKAIYSKNDRQFEDILNKYNITWLLIDEQITSTSHPRALYTEYIKKFLESNNTYSLNKTFGDIFLYKKNTPLPSIIMTDINTSVSPDYVWNDYDRAFEDYGMYTNSGNPSVYYPYRTLFSGRGSVNIKNVITKNDNELVFTPATQNPLKNAKLILPEINKNEASFLNKVLPVVSQDGTISIPLVTDEVIFTGKGDPMGTEVICWPQGTGIISQQSFDSLSEQFIRISSENATACRTISLPALDQRIGYVIGVKSRNMLSNPLKMWIENLTSRHVEQQFYLSDQKEFEWEYFVIPPLAEDGLGYTVHFDNVSIGEKETVNDLAEVFIYPIPYHFITGITYNSEPIQPITNIVIPNTQQLTFTKYLVSLPENISNNSSLVLFQGYHKDWDAYYIDQDSLLHKSFPTVFGSKISTHLKVNNWANGWELDPENKITDTVMIVYWPQIFQFTGFGLLMLLPLFLIKKHLFE